MNYAAKTDEFGAIVYNIKTQDVLFTVPVTNANCLGLSSSGSVLAIATHEDDYYTLVTAYDSKLAVRSRLHTPFPVTAIAVNNSVSAIALVVQTNELPYDMVLIYNTKREEMVSVFHGYGAAVSRLRFVTNNSLMINVGVVVLDLD